MKIEITCASCGERSWRKPSLVFSVMFCNRECRTTYRRGRATSRYRERVIDGVRMYEHRLVAERMLGRALLRGEEVHHRDNCGSNNDPLNLEVLTKSEHSLRHGEPKWFQAAVALAKNGEATPDIAAKLSIPYRTVWRKLSARGIKTAVAKRKSDVDTARVARMLAEGATLRQAARAVGMSHSSVASALRRCGLGHLVPLCPKGH